MKSKPKKPPDPSQLHLLCSSLLSSQSFALSCTSLSLNPESYVVIEILFRIDSIEIVPDFVLVRPMHPDLSSLVLISTPICCFTLLNRDLIQLRGPFPGLNLVEITFFSLPIYQLQAHQWGTMIVGYNCCWLSWSRHQISPFKVAHGLMTQGSLLFPCIIPYLASLSPPPFVFSNFLCQSTLNYYYYTPNYEQYLVSLHMHIIMWLLICLKVFFSTFVAILGLISFALPEIAYFSYGLVSVLRILHVTLLDAGISSLFICCGAEYSWWRSSKGTGADTLDFAPTVLFFVRISILNPLLVGRSALFSIWMLYKVLGWCYVLLLRDMLVYTTVYHGLRAECCELCLTGGSYGSVSIVLVICCAGTMLTALFSVHPFSHPLLLTPFFSTDVVGWLAEWSTVFYSDSIHVYLSVSLWRRMTHSVGEGGTSIAGLTVSIILAAVLSSVVVGMSFWFRLLHVFYHHLFLCPVYVLTQVVTKGGTITKTRQAFLYSLHWVLAHSGIQTWWEYIWRFVPNMSAASGNIFLSLILLERSCGQATCNPWSTLALSTSSGMFSISLWVRDGKSDFSHEFPSKALSMHAFELRTRLSQPFSFLSQHRLILYAVWLVCAFLAFFFSYWQPRLSLFPLCMEVGSWFRGLFFIPSVAPSWLRQPMDGMSYVRPPFLPWSLMSCSLTATSVPAHSLLPSAVFLYLILDAVCSFRNCCSLHSFLPVYAIFGYVLMYLLRYFSSG